MSALRNLVRRTFIGTVNKAEIEGELKDALKRNKDRYIDQWTQEINKANINRKFTNKPDFKVQTVESTIAELTDNLIYICKKRAEAKVESYLSKRAKEAESARLKDLEDTVDGKPSGDYADVIDEGGVLIGDTKEVTNGSKIGDQKKGSQNQI